MPFVDWLRAAPQQIEVERLFRHELLNPRDVYLTPGRRQELSGLVARIQEPLAPLSDRMASASSREMAQAISSKQARQLPRDAAWPSAETRGWRRQTNGRDGTVWIAPPRAFPVANALKAELERRGEELGVRILQWFERARLLTPAEAQQLRRSLREGH